MIEIIIIFFVILFLIPYLINVLLLKNKLNNFEQVLNFSKETNFYLEQNKKFNSLIYAPHHATNWSLNPSYKSKKQNLISNTKEGFRKVDESDSIISSINNSKDKKKIICIGGSTTHCVEMEDYNDTWPSILNKQLGTDKFQIFNFGVGGWNTSQSLTRLLYWSPLIKPDLIIFYQAKNDLTPFVNINSKFDYIIPDFQNTISQFSQSFISKIPNIFLKVPFFKLILYFLIFKSNFQHHGLLNMYQPNFEQNTEGLKRIREYHLESIFLRIASIFNTAKFLKCKMIYIPEIVLEGPYKNILETKIYPEVKNNLINNFKDIHFVDLKDLLSNDKNNFLDKMHFSKQGNIIFSSLIKKKILEILNNV